MPRSVEPPEVVRILNLFFVKSRKLHHRNIFVPDFDYKGRNLAGVYT